MVCAESEILFGFLSFLIPQGAHGRSVDGSPPSIASNSRERERKKRGTKNQLVVSEESEIDQRDNRSKWSMTKHSEKSIYPPWRRRRRRRRTRRRGGGGGGWGGRRKTRCGVWNLYQPEYWWATICFFTFSPGMEVVERLFLTFQRKCPRFVSFYLLRQTVNDVVLCFKKKKKNGDSVANKRKEIWCVCFALHSPRRASDSLTGVSQCIKRGNETKREEKRREGGGKISRFFVPTARHEMAIHALAKRAIASSISRRLFCCCCCCLRPSHTRRRL